MFISENWVRKKEKRKHETTGWFWPVSKMHRLRRFTNRIVAWKSGQSYGTESRRSKSHERHSVAWLFLQSSPVLLSLFFCFISDRWYIIKYANRYNPLLLNYRYFLHMSQTWNVYHNTVYSDMYEHIYGRSLELSSLLKVSN